MALREELERQGNWLFRWRSYLPLLIVPLFFVALYSSVRGTLGDPGPDHEYWEAFCSLVAWFRHSLPYGRLCPVWNIQQKHERTNCQCAQYHRHLFHCSASSLPGKSDHDFRLAVVYQGLVVLTCPE